MTDYNTAVVRNVQNNDLYLYLGNDMYRNLRTLKEGKIEPEIARKVFNISMDATVLISKYPLISKMINTLGLKCEHISQQ